MTKYQTLREDIQRVGNFKNYMKKHYDSWVEFASTTGHGDDINPVLVTGVDRTGDFAMMSYSNDDDDDDDELGSEFIISAPGDSSASTWGTWYTTGFVHTNCGPQLRFSTSSTQTTDSTDSSGNNAEPVSDGYNQCVFVRYYTMRKKLGIPKVIKASAGPYNLDPRGRENSGSPKVEAGSPSGSGSDLKNSVTSAESEPSVIHTTPAVRSLPSLSDNFRPF